MREKPFNPDGDNQRHLELVHSVEAIEPVYRFEDGCSYSASTGLTDKKGKRIPSLMHRLGHWKELEKNE